MIAFFPQSWQNSYLCGSDAATRENSEYMALSLERTSFDRAIFEAASSGEELSGLTNSENEETTKN